MYLNSKKFNEYYLLKKESFNYKRLKWNKNIYSSKKLICHHCKFVGKETFFFECHHKAGIQKIDKDEFFKEFFNIKNNAKIHCDKKYCINCVKSHYNYPIKAYKINSWVCPFCRDVCFCLSCEYRDHYMRLFSLY